MWTDSIKYTCEILERQKATRRLKKLQKRLAALPADSSEHPALREEIDIAATDLDYTLYHPLDQKYQSLYPLQASTKGETDGKPGHEKDRGGIEQSTNAQASKPKMWDVVAQCRETGQLEALRDGRLGDGGVKMGEEDVGAGSSNVKVEKKEKKALREVEEEKSEGDQEESDGGFFDE